MSDTPICDYCGKPAEGSATGFYRERLCHGDHTDGPTCYMIATSLPVDRARLKGAPLGLIP